MAGALLVIGAVSVSAEPALMENLGRGVVAIRQDASSVYVGWRLLGTDPPDIAFNLYRSTGGGDDALLNAAPIGDTTNFVDAGADLSQAVSYSVRPVVGGVEQAASAPFVLPANAPTNQYLSVPLQVPPGGVTPVGQAYTYSANDASVGDLDGDGEYEIVLKWDPSNAQDNANDGYTGNVYLDAYKMNGTRLWRIDLGRNIRAGAHYTQFMVYDLDGDGKAEVACKTADGTIDGAGQVIGDPNADFRNAAGRILDGPEFLTIFNGETGAALATTDYIPARGTVADWGDNYGNRVDRFLAAIAYLDGKRPSLVMCRGYYTRAVLVAWSWRDGVLTQAWTFDSNDGTPGNTAYQGQGNHNLSVGDIDGDGKQEIVYGAAAIDDDGTGLYTTGWGHGDALHLSDMDPDRPGVEVFQPHEVPSVAGAEFRDAETGQLIWGVQTGGDNGRGMADDIDPTRRGFEMWTGQGVGLRDLAGNQISSSAPPINFAVWWDADLTREMLDGTTVSKWDWTSNSTTPLLSPAEVASNNSTKANPVLSGDILGDWREEVAWRTADSTALRIYTTTIPATNRIYTLMHDPQYRVSIAWQNVAYNQPPHTSFFMGEGMNPPPTPDIVTDLADLAERAATPIITGVSDDLGVSSADRVTSDTTLLLNGTAGPGDTVTVSQLGAGVLGTAGVGPSGAWTFDTATELPQGSHYFTATAADSLGHTSGTMAPFQVVVDAAAPTVVSVTRLNPLGELTSASAVTFRVAFSERAGGVTTGSFALTATDTVTGVISAVSASQGLFVDVTVGSIVGLGTLRLDVRDSGSGITDIAGNVLSGGFTSGEMYTFLNPTWVQLVSGGLWSDPANWSGGVIGEGLGLTASFNALDLTADNVVHLDSPHTLGSVIFGDADPLTPGSWIVDDSGDPANVLTLAVASGNPTITVNPMGTDSTATISAGVATAAGLTKAGGGVLALAGPSTIPGTMTVSGGVLRVAPGGTFAPPAVNVGPAGARLNVAGGSFATAGNVRITPGSGAGVYVDSGTATFNTIDTTNSAGGVVQFNGGTITANRISFPRSSDATISYATGLVVKGGSATVGTIGLGTNNSNGAMSIEGGELTVTGMVSVGNLGSNSNRGGAMRVTGGTFTSLDAVDGVVMTQRNNNTSLATFTGGVSTVEKFTLGHNSSVIAGKATINVNGGAVYVGSGGIVKNGITAFTTVLTFSSGIVGAGADWSTALPITLPAGGNVALKAADAGDVPHAILLGGVLSGEGGFTKTGAGVLTLGGASTFTGPAAVDGGVFEVNGSLGAGGALAVNSGGTLTGVGSIARAIALNEGGRIVPGSAAPGSVLSGESVAWSGGAQLVFDLAAGNRLALTGALTKAGLPLQHVVLGASAPLTVGVAYPLATYASTDLLPSDLSYSGLTGYLGVFLVGPNSLSFLVTGAGPTAEFTHWAYLMGLPEGQSGAADDPDNDGQTNLLEFVLGHDPMRTSVEGIVATTVVVEDRRYPAISFPRRVNLGGVTTDVLVSPDLTFATQLGWVEVSAESRGDGTETVVVRSAVPLWRQPRQFFRLAATLPAFAVQEQTTVLSSPVGVLTERLAEGLSGLSMPLIAGDLLVGIVESNTTSALAFPAGDSVGALLSSGGKYYAEVLTGPFAGERLDVDSEATIAAGDSTVALALGPETFSTLPELAPDLLVGARCALRPHVTLASLQAMITPGLRGSDHAHFADSVLILEDHGFASYHLRKDGATWRRHGSPVDERNRVIPPDVSVLVQTSSHRQSWRHAGQVRTNPFRKNLVAGLQAFATGFPEDLTPVEIGAFVDPQAPAQTTWTGSNHFTHADQIQRVAGHRRPFELFYLRADGTTWRALQDPRDVANKEILGVTDMLLLRRVKPNPAYAIAPPFGM